MEKLKRYIVFLIGLFINSLGVSLITKADLGTSPISSIPYVLSLNFPFTLGQFTIAFSLLLILIQLVILRRNFKAAHLLQIPISILFGYFIDLTMVMLFFVNPQSYLSSVVYLLIGCVILGFGVYTEVLANVAMLPGESFVRAVSSTWKTGFGSTGYTPKFVQDHEENMTNSFLYDLISQMYIYSDTQEAPRDAIFESEGEVILSLAGQGNCVILGRCADYFLRDRHDCLKVYLHAPEDYRVKRIMDTENLTEEDARQKVRRMDRRRSDNYHYYARRIWGHSKNYDLTIDTSIGAEAVEEIIRRTLELREKQKISS